MGVVKKILTTIIDACVELDQEELHESNLYELRVGGKVLTLDYSLLSTQFLFQSTFETLQCECKKVMNFINYAEFMDCAEPMGWYSLQQQIEAHMGEFIDLTQPNASHICRDKFIKQYEDLFKSICLYEIISGCSNDITHRRLLDVVFTHTTFVYLRQQHMHISKDWVTHDVISAVYNSKLQDCLESLKNISLEAGYLRRSAIDTIRDHVKMFCFACAIINIISWSGLFGGIVTIISTVVLAFIGFVIDDQLEFLQDEILPDRDNLAFNNLTHGLYESCLSMISEQLKQLEGYDV